MLNRKEYKPLIIASLLKICVEYLWQIEESKEAKKKKAKIKISMPFSYKESSMLT